MATCMNCAPWLLYPDHGRCRGKVWSVLAQRWLPCSCSHSPNAVRATHRSSKGEPLCPATED